MHGLEEEWTLQEKCQIESKYRRLTRHQVNVGEE
jgi:hypothetical protein